jgi:hypothetical protein
MIHTDISSLARSHFKFESIWSKFPDYHKLCNTTKSLKRWSQKFVGSIRLQLAMPKEVIFKLEQAQDHRALSVKELQLRRELKCKCLVLALLARIIAQ